jgi:hypothetical protein
MSEPIELVSGVSPMLMPVARSIVWLLCAAARRPYCCAAMSMPLLRLPAAEPVLRIHRESPKRSKYSSGHRVHIRHPAIPTEKHKEQQDKRLPKHERAIKRDGRGRRESNHPEAKSQGCVVSHCGVISIVAFGLRVMRVIRHHASCIVCVSSSSLHQIRS